MKSRNFSQESPSFIARMPAEAEKRKDSFSNIRMSRDAKEAKTSSALSTRSKLRPILSLELTEEIPLIKFYVGRLREKRNTSKAIQLISTAAPGSFGYLKRCNGFQLLLCPVAENSPEELKESLASKGFDLSLLEEAFEVLNIPGKPSRTKIQAEKCCKIWPINFHPDPITESIIAGEIFNDKKLYQMELLMRRTIEAAEIVSIGNSECNGSALIVDPINGQPVALASSKLDEHPLWHASILAIDLVAKIQGGGAWDLIENNDDQDSENKKFSKRKFEPVYPLCYPPSLCKIKFPEAEPLQELSRQKNKNEEIDSSKETGKTGPYLCTNFWVFLIQEPCALCAMALLHSRASKIFYGIRSSSGVLGSKALLHTTPGLNHRYQVWSGILEKECRAVSDKIKTRDTKLD